MTLPLESGDGGPAFPQAIHHEAKIHPITRARTEHLPGMSLRDYFAGAALTGIIASVACSEANPTWEDVAAKAYAQADAMMAQRKATP